jgi:uncharacterized protein (DUF1330 family)
VDGETGNVDGRGGMALSDCLRGLLFGPDGCNWCDQGRRKAYGGRYLARLGEVQVLEGPWNPNMIVIVEFPNLEQARAWYRSPEYAFALEVRDTALRRNLVLVDGVPL